MEREPAVPIGNDFLKVVQDQERRCEESFTEWFPSAGVKVPQTIEALGTALSYLDRIATCWWGCNEDAHTEERLIGRTASNTRAAFQLLRAGYYDEAFTLVRQIGETANLMSLFIQSEESYVEWRDASEKVRRNKFRAVKIRLKLEKLPLPLLMDEQLYSLLSERSVHVNPHTTPQGHNPFGLPTLGSYFQEAGALLVLNHLAEMVGFTLWLGVILVKPTTDRKSIVEAAVELLRSIGGVNLHSVQDYYGRIQESAQFQEYEAVLRQRQSIRRQLLSENQPGAPHESLDH